MTSRLTIDFRNSQVCREQLSKPMAEEGDYQFWKGSVRKMRFYVPVTWNGKSHDFIFDSGASAFDLITDEIYWRDLVGAVPGEYSEVVVQGARTNWTEPAQGLIGNSLFFDRKIVIEYGENPRMGISNAVGHE